MPPTPQQSSLLNCLSPQVPVLVITSNEKTAAHLLTTKAALPFLLPKVNELPTNEVVSAGFQYAMSLKFVKPGSLVVFVTGTEGKHTLTVKVLSVPEKTQ
jgi:pyruvate kinase